MRRSIRCALLILFVASAGAAWAQSAPENLVLNFQRLAILDEAVDGHYEGWAIVGGSPVSTGKFNVNALGEPVGLGGGAVIAEFDAGVDISVATAIKISIEPPGDADGTPDPHIILDGAPTLGVADLVVGIPGLSTLESMTTGAFILATPSDNGVDASNDEMGIWFLEPGPLPGFNNLPDLGAHWQYEGWAVDTSGGGPTPYSTSTFTMASGTDANAAGCNGGGPPFPGEDFVAFHCGPILTLNSGDFVAVLSIEPVPDPNPGPFQLKPLVGSIPADAVGMGAQSMDNQVSASFPVGTALLFGNTVPVETASFGSLKSRY